MASGSNGGRPAAVREGRMRPPRRRQTAAHPRSPTSGRGWGSCVLPIAMQPDGFGRYDRRRQAAAHRLPDLREVLADFLREPVAAGTWWWHESAGVGVADHHRLRGLPPRPTTDLVERAAHR